MLKKAKVLWRCIFTFLQSVRRVGILYKWLLLSTHRVYEANHKSVPARNSHVCYKREKYDGCFHFIIYVSLLGTFADQSWFSHNQRVSLFEIKDITSTLSMMRRLKVTSFLPFQFCNNSPRFSSRALISNNFPAYKFQEIILYVSWF